MEAAVLTLILSSVFVSAAAQLLLKRGAAASIGDPSWSSLDLADRISTLLLEPSVIGGLALYALGAIIWLFVLARVDLSLAYPFVGLGFVLTLVLSHFLLGESVAMTRIAGTVMIAVGCVLVARSA